nr:hypothetical protein [Tanacetum cinerariifolium]
MSFKPDILDTPVYKAKPNIAKQYSQQSEVQKGKIFDNKESLILAVRLKAVNEGRKDIQQDILSEYKIHISYQQAMKRKHYGIQPVRGSPYEAFEMLSYYCYNLEKKNKGTVTRIKTDDNRVFEMLFIAIGASIRTFLNHLRPVLMIDAVHLKGLYKGTNLVAVAMDGNNQIVPIAFGICKGETGPCWSWHAAIALAVEKEFPLAFHVPDAHEKLCRVGPQRWSRAHCPLVRYNYMTSNSVESVNTCSVIYRKEPVLKLEKTYRAMVQEWYYKCQQLAANMTYGITDWAANKVAKKRMKSVTWVVNGVNAYQYEVSDGQYVREVNLQTGICGCRKWQLSGLSCGHVIAITWFLCLTDYVHYAADWFKKPKYQATYSESIHSLGNMHQWEFPNNIQKAIPPRMDNPQPGRPKNTSRIQSQGEELRIIRCTRFTQTRHRRDKCSQPFVV